MLYFSLGKLSPDPPLKSHFPPFRQRRTQKLFYARLFFSFSSKLCLQLLTKQQPFFFSLSPQKKGIGSTNLVKGGWMVVGKSEGIKLDLLQGKEEGVVRSKLRA